MRFAASKFFGSIRFRLMMWSTLVLLLAIAAALVGVREGMRFLLRRESDEVLREDALEAVATLESLLPDWTQAGKELEMQAKSHAKRGLFAQAFDQTGKLVYATAAAPSNLQPTKTLTNDELPVDLDEYTVIDKQVTKEGIPPLMLRVGAPRDILVQRDIAQLTRMVLLVGGILIIVAPLGGYWLSGRTTRPLQEIIRLAHRAHPSRLNERLPLRGSNDELDRLSGTFNGMLDRIAAYIHAHREFVANAAHELRSPLTAIQSSVEVTLESPRSAEDYRELLYDMVEECQQLRVLVNQLLMLAENEGGMTEAVRHPVRLEHIVERTIAMFQGVADERDITLEAKLGVVPELAGDADSLRQLVNNLVDNALKFTPRNGTVRVTLECNHSTGIVTLTVTDSGSGIAAADLPHIFERFYRGDRSRHRNEASGSGLGLAICSAVAQAHGGQIEVVSPPGAGATFRVHLPLVNKSYELDSDSNPIVEHTAEFDSDGIG
jgi:heavy metal sensor kinase